MEVSIAQAIASGDADKLGAAVAEAEKCADFSPDSLAKAKQQLAVMREEGPLLAGMQAAMADNDYGALKKARTQARETTIREFGNIPPSRSVF